MYLQIQKLRVSVDKTANKELINEFQQLEKRLREGHHITAQVILERKSFSFFQCFSLPLTALVATDTVCLWTKALDVLKTGFLYISLHRS